MHEMSLISAVISTLEKQVKKLVIESGNEMLHYTISKVHLKLGPGPHNLEPERVRDIFEIVARGTIAQGAVVEIESAPADQKDELVIEKFEVVEGIAIVTPETIGDLELG
jgi:Zn finger protein HypA/HybF involved in hydrogenase expression